MSNNFENTAQKWKTISKNLRSVEEATEKEEGEETSSRNYFGSKGKVGKSKNPRPKHSLEGSL